MTFGQLRTFVAVAGTGSVRAAADRLVVSASAVSASLAALQRELAVALVTPDGRGLALTPAGRRFERYARTLLGLLDEARAATLGAADPERGRLRIAAVTTAGEHVLPRHLAAFRGRHAGIEIGLEVGNRSRVFDLLEHHEVDLAVGGRPPGARRFRDLASCPNPLVAVGRPLDARRSRARRVSVDQLAAVTWLLREPGSGTRAAAEELFEQYGIAPTSLTVGSNGAIRESVLAGLGVTLVARDAVARELDEGSLEELRGPGLPLRRAWHVAARADEDLPTPSALFLRELLSSHAGRRFRRSVAG
jgi:DNA-binding transcriptional LysR family regulator